MTKIDTDTIEGLPRNARLLLQNACRYPGREYGASLSLWRQRLMNDRLVTVTRIDNTRRWCVCATNEAYDAYHSWLASKEFERMIGAANSFGAKFEAAAHETETRRVDNGQRRRVMNEGNAKGVVAEITYHASGVREIIADYVRRTVAVGRLAIPQVTMHDDHSATVQFTELPKRQGYQEEG